MSSVVSNAVGLSASQRAAAEVIEREMTAAGIPPAVIAAAIVNAWAESRLNPAAIAQEKKGGVSVGLFQLYDRGLGSGMSVADRQDPATNTRVVIRAYQKMGSSLAMAAASGASVGDLAALWCKVIENPASSTAKGLERKAYALRIFPSGLNMPLWVRGADAPIARVSSSPRLLVGAILATTLLVGAALWRRRSS